MRRKLAQSASWEHGMGLCSCLLTAIADRCPCCSSSTCSQLTVTACPHCRASSPSSCQPLPGQSANCFELAAFPLNSLSPQTFFSPKSAYRTSTNKIRQFLHYYSLLQGYGSNLQKLTYNCCKGVFQNCHTNIRWLTAWFSTYYLWATPKDTPKIK